MDFLTDSQLYAFYTTTMKYRYYIGFQLPQQLSDTIAGIQHALHDPIESIEPLEPHITLLPPPAVEDVEPSSLAAKIKAGTHDLLPMELALTEVITFKGHAVALKVEGNAIFELQKRMEALLPAGINLKYFPHPQFVPHVTLVQAIRGRTLPAQLIQEYKQECEGMLPTKFVASGLTLFEWLSPRNYKAVKF
jgi:2'-5' RNA ligase